MYLAIETSGMICSAALLDGARCVRSFADCESQQHARQLPLFVEQLLAFSREEGVSIEAVALSQGPGSYTGLRIGTATAKGLCYGLGVPMIAIDTLQLMAYSALKQLSTLNSQLRLCPMIDARRMEVYTALYDLDLQRISDVEAKVIDASFQVEKTTCFFGDGAAKCKEIVTSPNAVFLDGINPLASEMGELAEKAYNNNQFADVAYFDPFYLKEFQATVAKNKVF